jgi:hypothetical protein
VDKPISIMSVPIMNEFSLMIIIVLIILTGGCVTQTQTPAANDSDWIGDDSDIDRVCITDS